MFDKRSDYALNHLDKTAIVCQSVTGEHIRLTCKDFASEEEFLQWKSWSDDNYHKIQLAGRDDDDCLSFDALRDTPAPSAEDVFFAPILAADKAEWRQWTLTQIKAKLTKKQYRRLCLFEKCVNEGFGAQRIATYLNRLGYRARTGKNWHHATIRGIICNLTYTGVLRSGESRSQVLPHLQLISQEMFDAAQQIRTSRANAAEQERTVPRNIGGGSPSCLATSFAAIAGRGWPSQPTEKPIPAQLTRTAS